MERQGCLVAVKKGSGSRWCSLSDNKGAYAQFMKRLRPFAWFIIIVNLGLVYTLFSSLQKLSDPNGQAGAFMGYLFSAGFINVILYVLFRITAKRK